MHKREGRVKPLPRWASFMYLLLFILLPDKFAEFLPYVKSTSAFPGDTGGGAGWSAQVGVPWHVQGQAGWVPWAGGGEPLLGPPLTPHVPLGKSPPSLGPGPLAENEGPSLRSLSDLTGSGVWGKHEGLWPRSRVQTDPRGRGSHARVMRPRELLWTFSSESPGGWEPRDATFSSPVPASHPPGQKW